MTSKDYLHKLTDLVDEQQKYLDSIKSDIELMDCTICKITEYTERGLNMGNAKDTLSEQLVFTQEKYNELEKKEIGQIDYV